MTSNAKLLLASLSIFLVDQATKYIFYDMALRSNSSLLQPVLNTGIARSIPFPSLLVIAISIVAIFLFLSLYKKKELTRLVTALLLGGTIGNLTDRLIYAGVRDMFVTPRYIYNIADVALNIAIVLVIIISLKELLAKRN